eukprot:CAMPEP_0119375752 /NCGR_PEP_ID=MMETSP1334-20130426/36591_1 /TAXON_ID=127549 /ORGANISM="Calcidiscus leptoporus, Strain RCC1130" /LENGTH=521 /DNA_ID=CAMNT_0007394135 /DNA_START=143 /DNA_END=1708 /DNA_ORIENTATION=-
MNYTKTELEASFENNAKKSASIDRVQKAQTKRWLKNEYSVALRASIEDELEQVCNRDELRATKALRAACQHVVERGDETLPRSVLDGKAASYCAQLLAGCEGEAAIKALNDTYRQLRSEAVPAAGKDTFHRGAVRKLVASTYTKFVMRKGLHALVMLHNSVPPAKTKGKPKNVGKRFLPAVDEFYALAQACNTSAKDLIFAQLDLRLNEVPGELELPDASGFQFIFYPKDNKESPRTVPAVGDAAVDKLPLAELRTQISQLLLTFIKGDAASAVTALMAKRSLADGNTKPQPQQPPAAEAAAAPSTHASTAAATGSARRRRGIAEGALATALRQQEECDVCAAMVGELARALDATKTDLELSHDAALKKQAYIDGVQKAQTKRWLKREYSVALAASLEERLEKLCDDAAMGSAVCDNTTRAGSTPANGAWRRDSASMARKDCLDTVKKRCRAVAEEHTETLQRGVLDGKRASLCPRLYRRCVAWDDNTAEAAVPPPAPDSPPVMEASQSESQPHLESKDEV